MKKIGEQKLLYLLTKNGYKVSYDYDILPFHISNYLIEKDKKVHIIRAREYYEISILNEFDIKE